MASAATERRAAGNPLPDTRLPSTASIAVARTDSLVCPPEASPPPKPQMRPEANPLGPPRQVRSRHHLRPPRRQHPDRLPGVPRHKCSATTSASTASPKNAKLSLSTAGACSWAQDRCVSARSSKRRSTNTCPNRSPNTTADRSGSINAPLEVCRVLKVTAKKARIACARPVHHLAAPGGAGGRGSPGTVSSGRTRSRKRPDLVAPSSGHSGMATQRVPGDPRPQPRPASSTLRCARILAERQRRVRPAEPECVAERDLHVLLPRLVRHVVEVALGIGRLVVDRRRQDPVMKGEHGGNGLDAPAAPSRCPVIDLVEETASLCACSPNTRLIARVSNLSLYCVEVPWALMYPTAAGSSPASRRAAAIARAAPSPWGSGAVM